MKLSLVLIISLSVLVLAGCSSTPTKVNAGTVHARTFNFVHPKSKPAPSFSDNTEARNLAARGVTRVDAGGDVTIAYLIITGDNVSTTAIRDYFGYGDDLGALHDKAQDAYTSTKNPDHFEAGTLLIDIVDGKSFKLLKRGYTTRPLSRSLAAGARAARIQEAVDEILRDVRIEP
jgi:hypothetical protein